MKSQQPAHYEHCPHCGGSLLIEVCAKCHTPAPPGAKFCPGCGAGCGEVEAAESNVLEGRSVPLPMDRRYHDALAEMAKTSGSSASRILGEIVRDQLYILAEEDDLPTRRVKWGGSAGSDRRRRWYIIEDDLWLEVRKRAKPGTATSFLRWCVMQAIDQPQPQPSKPNGIEEEAQP